ncbi:MAG: phosphate ABC transporter permease PstA [Chloroflexota bacterium]
MNKAQTIGKTKRLVPRSQPANQGARRVRSVLAHTLTGLCTLISVGLLVYLLGFLIVKGAGVISWEFLTSEAPATNEPGGGIAASLYGTGLIVSLSVLMGVPLGILLGIYLAEVASATSVFANIARMAVNTFTGIPSIIVGLFVYTLVVKSGGLSLGVGFSALGGGIALAIIMIPILARTAEDVLRLVPGSIREAGLALGIPFWRVTLGVVLPAARAGIITGGVLAVARVAGETAPLVLTALGNEYINWNISEPTDELTLRILKYARSPFETQHAHAYGAAFVLVMGVAIAALLLRLATRGRGIKVQ